MSTARLFTALARAEGALLRGDSGSWNGVAVLDAVADLATRLGDSRVLAVLADNSPEWVIADLAALHGRCVHLPLPAFFSPAQLAHAVEQTGADTLLTDQPERAETLGFVRAGDWRGLAWMRRRCAPVALPPDTAKVTFTSGSTGTPRGVCLSRQALLGTAEALVSTLSDVPIERHLSVLPLALLLENVAGIYAPLLRGAEIVLPSLASLGWRGMAGFDAAALQAVVEREQPHSLILVPELLKAWLGLGIRSGTGLLFAAVGGARCDASLIAAARERGLPVYEGYGLTECGSVVSLNHPGDDVPGSVGRPLPHVRTRVDAQGEIHIASPGFLGYLGDEIKAAASEDHEYATGDLGWLDDEGFLHLSGRRKNLLVTAFGRNVAPEWVEAALLAQPEIAQAVVFGDECPWLAAVLVAMPGVSETDLAAAVARTHAGLPDYARVRGWIAVPPFTPANGQATGNGRPIRGAIAARHGDAIAALYLNQEHPHVVL